METKIQTMDMGATKVENGVDARNSRDVPITGSGNRTPNCGKSPERQQSSGGDPDWPTPHYSEKGYMIRERQNYKRYADYGG